MYAEVELAAKQHEDVLATPIGAIERSGSATRVFAVDKAGVIRIASVQLGAEDAQRAEVVSGLQEGELVITGRRAGLNAGDKVKPKLMDSGQ